MDILYHIHNNLLDFIDFPERIAARDLDWDCRALGIYGARGVGKTTLLLQKGLQRFGGPEKCLYVSADHVAVEGIGLFEIARQHLQAGGVALIIDEAHRAGNWSQHIKSIYDSFPQLILWLSGSSSLALHSGNGDLSRRIVWQELPHLSFCEFLNIRSGLHLQPYPLAELIENAAEISRQIKKSIPTPLAEFKQYNKFGFYPFFVEGEQVFQTKLETIIEKILSDDIPLLFNVDRAKITTIRKILWIIASSEPGAPNIEKLSRDLGIAKETVYHYLDILHRAALTANIQSKQTGLKVARKPGKVLVANPNLLQAFCGREVLKYRLGSLRESFLVSSLLGTHKLQAGKQADFIVDDVIAVEVGGENKGALQQEPGIKRTVFAIDDSEFAHGDKIPLFMFGFVGNTSK